MINIAVSSCEKVMSDIGNAVKDLFESTRRTTSTVRLVMHGEGEINYIYTF